MGVIQVDSERYCICLVNMPPWPAALQAGVPSSMYAVQLSFRLGRLSQGHLVVLGT